MKLYNTLSRSIESFEPLHPDIVTMYCCGPTVYDYTHIGHIRKYVMDDILRRTLEYSGYHVKQVMNVTDVGHLTDDGDAGDEDKLEKGARKSGKTVEEVAVFYTDFFVQTMKEVNVDLPPGELFCKATDHIKEMVELIKKLDANGHIYQTKEAVYFDISTFPSYGKLSKQKLNEKKQAVREDVNIDPDKKNPADFAVWFKRVGRFENHTMHWDPKEWGAEYGDGFPGWHIECSAMSMQYLGEEIDIHTGGIDHIPVHHENEIAQSEGATNHHPFVKYWVHHNFLMVEGTKMSKSLGNFITIEDIKKKGINPLALRLLFMQIHYRQEMNFIWEAAEAANEAYKRLKDQVLELMSQTELTEATDEPLLKEYKDTFTAALQDDLQTPKAIAVLWEMMKSGLSAQNKLYLLHDFDQVLGFGLKDIKTEEIPVEIMNLVEEREDARKNKDFAKSDELRNVIQAKGYILEDSAGGAKVKKA
jgi:cysteinyl-tRNA synthetase